MTNVISSSMIPEPGQFRLDSIEVRIESGEIKIPQFQRNFVWNPKDTAKLFDSILKGYPIGTFTFWTTTERMRTVKEVGGFPLPQAAPGTMIKYLLDGQQRMTSIYACIKGSKIGQNDYSKISFRLIGPSEDGQLVVEDPEGLDATEYISITDLYSALNSKLRRVYDDNTIDFIEHYRQCLKSYPLSIINLSNAPLDVATDIFTRINTSGKTLTMFEIICARMYDESNDFDLYDKRSEQKQNFANANYDSVPDATILQAISLCINGSCKKDDILRTDKNSFMNAWDPVNKAFEKAIDYLKTYYSIPVSKLLPYDALIVLFVYYFYKTGFDRPEAAHEPYLRDYFWRVVLTNRFTEGLVSKLSQDKQIIDKIIAGEKPDGLPPVDISANAIKNNGTFSLSSAYSKGFLCILASKHPKSFDNGADVIIDNDWLSASSAKNYHHFFPKAYMKNNFPTVDENEVNHVANITIVDSHLNQRKIKAKAPSVYINEFRTANPNYDLQATMDSHLIYDLKGFGVEDDNYSLFFQKRIEAYQKELKDRLLIDSNRDIVDD